MPQKITTYEQNRKQFVSMIDEQSLMKLSRKAIILLLKKEEDIARLERARANDKEEIANLKQAALEIANAKYLRATSNLVIRALIEHVKTMDKQFKMAKKRYAAERNISLNEVPRERAWNNFFETSSDPIFVRLKEKLSEIGRKNLGLDMVKVFDQTSKKIHKPDIYDGVIIDQSELFPHEIEIIKACCQAYPVKYSLVTGSSDESDHIDKSISQEND
jgi:hypothetical protein